MPLDPFILIDGSSYLFRAYHALPPLTTTKGQPTGAIYGMVNMLRKLIAQYNPNKIAVVFDAKGKNFRHALYEPYKANRTVMPQELSQQIEPLHAIIEAMGLPLVMVSGVEADDVIGTLATAAKAKGLSTLIFSGDKDFIQLIDDQILLINPMNDEILDDAQVLKKLDIVPAQMVDYLTLIGDSIDNVPGVPSVGPKTAVKWLKTYQSLEGIIAAAAHIHGKVGKQLRDTLPLLAMFKTLVTIQTDVKMDIKIEDCIQKEPDIQRLRTLLTDLEFKAWVKMLDSEYTHHMPVIEEKKTEALNNTYETILSEEQFEQWLHRLQNTTLWAFDTETTSLDYMQAKIVGLSFATRPGTAAYLPLKHDYEGAPLQLDCETVLRRLKPLLENEHLLKIGHNLKYDQEVLKNHGIELRGLGFDTMLESYVLNSTFSRHNLDALAKKYLNYETVSFEMLAGRGAKQLTFNQVPLEQAAFYAAEDADITLKLHHHLWPSLSAAPAQKEIFEAIEMPLIPILVSIERQGVLIDAEELALQGKTLSHRLEICEEQIYRLANKEFNINSPKQLQEILYQDLKLPILAKTPGGQASTAESVLEELALSFELPQIILDYRSLVKLKTTYIDKLPLQINADTGRVHTSYHQAVTATGRLSSSDPNLQNIPIRTAEGRQIRRAFIAPPGYKIISADYSQIELRILAHLSQDPALVKAFELGDDIHRNTAAAVWGVPLEFVSAEQRRSAKTINFGLMYGMSAFGLSKQLGIPVQAAEEQVQRYFSCFSEVKLFMNTLKIKAAEEGYVQTLMGRRLYLPDLKSPIMASRRAAERAAINAPMQGSNADIIKLAMIAMNKAFHQQNPKIRMIMQVHDELIFEVKKDFVAQALEQIKEIMENVYSLSVPLKVDIGVGNNWDEAH